jgi:DNA gyrase/topoisomerase IV subunit B
MCVTSAERNGVNVEMALRWSKVNTCTCTQTCVTARSTLRLITCFLCPKNHYNDVIMGFANGIRTADGGTHLDGLKSALTRTVNSSGRKLNKLKETAQSIPGEFIREVCMTLHVPVYADSCMWMLFSGSYSCRQRENP